MRTRRARTEMRTLETRAWYRALRPAVVLFLALLLAACGTNTPAPATAPVATQLDLPTAATETSPPGEGPLPTAVTGAPQGDGLPWTVEVLQNGQAYSTEN